MLLLTLGLLFLTDFSSHRNEKKISRSPGGDPDTFKNINEAYDVLRDPEKRRIYDEYGEDAIKEGMGAGGPGGGGMGKRVEVFFFPFFFLKRRPEKGKKKKLTLPSLFHPSLSPPPPSLSLF